MQPGYNIYAKYCDFTHLLCKHTQSLQLLLNWTQRLLAEAANLRTICKSHVFGCNEEELSLLF